MGDDDSSGTTSSNWDEPGVVRGSPRSGLGRSDPDAGDAESRAAEATAAVAAAAAAA